jgi:hypothetical protein
MTNLTPISEAELMQAVIDCAHLLGWKVAHFRPAMTHGRWSTPVSADGAGFPDLVLVRGGRVIFAELKAAKGRVRPEQTEWLNALLLADGPTVRTYTWRPDDWFAGRIEDVLR